MFFIFFDFEIFLIFVVFFLLFFGFCFGEGRGIYLFIFSHCFLRGKGLKKNAFGFFLMVDFLVFFIFNFVSFLHFWIFLFLHFAGPTPLRRTSLRRTAQNFAFFSLLPTTIFFLSSSLGCPLVEFWWCLKRRGPSNVHVWSSRAVVFIPGGPKKC